MFKFIFKAVVWIVFLLFISVVLAMWKGGEPFRYFGEGVVVVGRSIMKFGDIVDEFISGSKHIQKSYDKIRDVIDNGDAPREDRKP